MPSHQQRLINLAYIIEKKRQKLDREVTAETVRERQEREQLLCKRCGQTGHKDARSKRCRHNKNFDPEAERKRKREEEDDDDNFGEGPSTKRLAISSTSSTVEGSVSSMAASSGMGASADTRSTTATIRSGIFTNLSLARKLADKKARAAGKVERKKKVKNSATIKPCPDRVANDCYDTQKPHSTRGSKLCPGHIINKADYIEENVGKGFRRFVRKSGLASSVILPQAEKNIFLRIITEAVQDYREIAIKSQLFACFYILHCLVNGIDIDAIVFEQPFFYACIQKVLGRDITNPNVNLPSARINTVFQEYNRLFFNSHVTLLPGRSVNSNALASLATKSATNLVNHITENYSKNLRKYIKTRISEVFSLTAIQRNGLHAFIFNHSVNSTTGLTWPESIENSPENVEKANIIINACRVDDRPVTLKLLSANPERFLQRMYIMLMYLEDHNNGLVRDFNEVQVEATYAWIKQALISEDNFKPLNRKKRNRLSFLVYRCIRDDTNFANVPWLNVEQNQFLLDFIRVTKEQVRNSRAYLDENNTEIIRTEDCFRPEMSTSFKMYKLFHLVPLYNFQYKYIDIDIAHLKYLLNKVKRESQCGNLFDEGNSENKHEKATYAFSQIFDFEKLRIDLNYNGKEMFTNIVRTDGHGIDFILAGPKRQMAEFPDLDLADFTMEELNTRFHLWGVDPGQVNIFTASDGHGTDQHQTRKYSTAEYYTRAGFKKTNATILNLKNDDELFLQAERRITTYKTANLDTYIIYIRSVLDNLDTMFRFYDNRFTALRFLNYMGRQRADAEMVNIFVTGGKKYLKREFNQTGRDQKKGNPKRRKKKRRREKLKGRERDKENTKRKMKPFEQDDRIPLVALGDAVFPTSMKGTISGLSRRLVKLLKIAEYEGLLVTVPVTEYMTSKTCSNCYGNNTQNIQIDGIPLFGVLHCLNQSCNTLWQRDVNASRNMHNISWNVINSNQIPVMFRR